MTRIENENGYYADNRENNLNIWDIFDNRGVRIGIYSNFIFNHLRGDDPKKLAIFKSLEKYYECGRMAC